MTTTQAPQPDGPLFWTFVRGFMHVGRYRRHYAIAALWAVIMLLVPQWSSSGLAASSSAAPLHRGLAHVPENATANALRVSPIASSPSFSANAGFPGATISDLLSYAPPPPPPDQGGDEGDGGGAPLLTIPPPPAIALPLAPKEIQPLLRTISPLVRTGCSAAGLAGVVIAVAGPGLEPVPATQLAPYLAPAYAACALFPPFGARTVCALDDLYAVDTGGLIPSPAIIGIGIDVIEQTEELGLPGGTPPGTAEQLRTQLDCRRD